MLLAAVLALFSQPAAVEVPSMPIPSKDGLKVTMDLYFGPDVDGVERPFIVLCHQAGWSRGEYGEIGRKLVKLGYNSVAIDQRSGGAVNGVENETAQWAAKQEKGTEFADAQQDIEAALEWARSNAHGAPVIAWGSSYSASLVLRIAGERPGLVDCVIAFSPGEYFPKEGKTWVRQAARKIKVPVFVTSAKGEVEAWEPIFESIRSKQKTRFVPETEGNHGSRALWKEFDDSEAYWKALEAFLAEHFPAGKKG
jgi:dienelactone hydrolase